MGSYINSTKPDPYHQIIAVSQKTINTSFEYMWNQAQLDDDDNPLKHFVYDDLAPRYFLETDVGIPSIQLQVDTTDPQLYFIMRMTKGTFSSHRKKKVPIDWDIKDWSFAFAVTIGRKEVTKDSPEYLDYKNRAGLPNSDFTLARLFLDSTSTTKWDEELSSFGNHQSDWDALDTTTKRDIANFISIGWLGDMQDDGKDLLGYSAQRNKDDDELNKYVPSFPPTSIDYDIYPWKSGGSTPRNNDDMNALCYLMMSKFETPPTKGGIAYSGQFVDEDHDATFVMRHDLFWENWMFTVFHKLLRGLIVVPVEKGSVQWKGHGKYPFLALPTYNVGDDSKYDDYNCYWFQRKDSSSWYWGGQRFWTNASAEDPGDSNDWYIVEQRTMTRFGRERDPPPLCGILSFSPGGDTISLTGNYDFEFYANHRDRTHYDMTFHISFAVTIGIASISKGGLKFEKVGANYISVTVDPSGDMQWERDPEEVANELRGDLQTSLDDAFAKVEGELFNALANHHRLFLPGYGSFLYKNAVFNHEGDFMVHLTYNGADPPST